MNSVVGPCASCNERKETPLRVGFMGGYVCLSCVDARLQSEHDLIASQAAEIERLTMENEGLREANEHANRMQRLTMDQRETAERQLAEAMAALTPSAETKAAYMGEFYFSFTIMEMNKDDEPYECQRAVTVPWDTIKEIMAAILARTTLSNLQSKEAGE